jgi:amidophosphoribosyltransferase
MSVRGEFIAAEHEEKEIEKLLGADALCYARIPEMVDAAAVGNPQIESFCKACMDGAYPTGDVTHEMLADIESERLKAHREIEGG